MRFYFILLTTVFILFTGCNKKTANALIQKPVSKYAVRPHKTDAHISKINAKHLAYFNPNVSANGKLLVFLPGTAANPSFYTTILKEAADMGFHTLGLMYPNNYDIYLSCFFNKDSTCYEQYRLEKFDGSDKVKSLKVDYANSIQNRVIKLLAYLQQQNPSENWQQYLIDGEVDWSKCVIAGHSQGGGHAAFIGHVKPVARVVIFSSIDWIISLKTNAAWVSQAGATPKDRVFAFIHTKDEIFKYPNVQKQWLAFGLDSLGKAVNIDASNAPFDNTHTLVTTAKPPLYLLTPYHFTTCVNKFIPKNEKGEIDKKMLDAWAYLLGK
jgi:hypothetical protein